MRSAIAVALLLVSSPSLAASPEGGPAPVRELLAQQVGQKQRAMRKLKGIFRDEPSMKDVRDWALQYYRLEPERINRQASAARVKGLVPEVQAGLSNMTGNSFTNQKDGLYLGLPLGADGTNCTGGNSATCGYKEISGENQAQLTWNVSATWALDKLVFNAEELDARSTVSLEETLVREVTTVFFSRRRMIANLILQPPEGEEEVFYEQLRIEEMTANLDSFTGSEFSKRAYKGDFSLPPQ